MVDIFFFGSLNISSHSFLSYNASAAISADSLMRVVLYKIIFFPVALKILFSSLILYSFIIICLKEDCLALKI